MKLPFSQLRQEVASIQKARNAGTKDFEFFANLHGSEIFCVPYNQIGYIFCDTMIVYNGRTAITKENLQYYPAKVSFFLHQTKLN